MNKYVNIDNTPIKKSYLNTFEKILNQVILNNDEDKILNKCKTQYYVYLLGLIVDESNRNEKKKLLNIR